MMRNRKRLSPECRSAIGDYDKRTGSKSLSTIENASVETGAAGEGHFRWA